jgi:hypothetical protein
MALSGGNPHPVQTISGRGQDARAPQVATGGGKSVIVWEQTGANTRIKARHLSNPGDLSKPGELGPTHTLSPAGEDATAPQVSTDFDGNALVVWRRSDGANIRIEGRTLSAEGVLGPVETLSAANQNAGAARVAMGVGVEGNGDAVVVWERLSGPNTRIQARARSAAGVLGPIQTLSDAGQNATAPQVAIDFDGDAMIVWKRPDGTNTVIQTRRLSNAGVLGAVLTLSEAGQDADAPQVIMAADGRAVAVWQRFDGTNQRIQSFRSSP